MSDSVARTGGFVVGFPGRRDAAATALSQRQLEQPVGFAPRDLIQRIEEAFASGPKHFAPANRDDDPTAGWNPLDPEVEETRFVDPIEAARSAGYEEGVAAATAAFEVSAARDRAMLETLLTQIRAGHSVDREAVARRLRQTVQLLVEQLVGEAGVSGELLAARVHAAAELLADASESAMLRVHPDDVALLAGELPDTIFAVGDAQVARGSFVLEAASTIVEDGPAIWLDQLAVAIDRVPLPAISPPITPVPASVAC